MLYTYFNTVPEPSAFITVKKQRIRQDGKQVYMKDQTEFEIELYNPTKEKIMATIEMNAKSISSSGIVLKPGQRVFLERFLDDDKKFLYETYEVEDNEQTKEATQDNGMVTIKFYRESGTVTYRTNIFDKKYYNYDHNYGGHNYSGTGGFGWGELIYTNNVTAVNDSSKSIGVLNTSFETGMVEQGGKSNQDLKSVNGNFDYFHSWISEWQIIPYSRQPKMVKDLVKKCGKCNTKLKLNHKFCPECGNQIVRTETKIIYTNDVKVNHGDKQYFMSTYNITLDKLLEAHKNKIIYIMTSSLTENSLRAIIID